MTRKRDPNYSPVPHRRFRLARHQELMTKRIIKRLIKRHLIFECEHKAGLEGLPILTSDDGRPVIARRPDLRPGEINFVLR